MERITRSFDLPANVDILERLWRRLEHDAMLRGALDARFEPLSGGCTRVSVSTAYEADGERRIRDAVSRLQVAAQDEKERRVR